MLHGFWVGRGTGTAALEAKLLQHITVVMVVVLFGVFLYLQKAYDALYCYRCLEILLVYGVFPRTL